MLDAMACSSTRAQKVSFPYAQTGGRNSALGHSLWIGWIFYLMFDGFDRVLRVLEDFDCNVLAHVGFVGYVHRCRCTHTHTLSHLKCATHFWGHFVLLSSLPQDDFFSTCKCCQPVSPRYFGLQTAVVSSGARKVSLHQTIIARARERVTLPADAHSTPGGGGARAPFA